MGQPLSTEDKEKKWEGLGIDYSNEAKELGFKLDDYSDVGKWKRQCFTLQQMKEWENIGLNKEKDIVFAAYLRWKDYKPNQSLKQELEQLRKESENWWKSSKPAQEYLDIFFPLPFKEQRKEIKVLNLYSKKLTGDLDLSDFENLEELNCSDNQLTSLDLISCHKLKKLNCSDNYLQELKLPSQDKQLTELDISNNDLSKRDLSMFSRLVNLEVLDIGSDSYFESEKKKIQERINQGIYNHFEGSLEPLQNLSKLRKFDISNTDIGSGLEYLPESVKDFNCSADKRPEAKVKAIEEDWEYFNQDIKKCKEFVNSPAQQLLNGIYPEEREEKEGGWLEAIRIVDLADDGNNYAKNCVENEKREEIKELDISCESISKDLEEFFEKNYNDTFSDFIEKESKKIKLERGLRLKGFTNLQKLDCSGHQLTDLDLSDCPNLIELNCSGNELKNLDFLKTLPNPKNLEKLLISNNPGFIAKNLEFLIAFTNLKELDLGNGGKELKGSLKSLENMKDLEKVSISRTDVGEGLEYLPVSCKEINCELDYNYASVAIAKQLSKFSEGGGNYSLEKWRVDQANNKAVSAIPLERLFVIRSNLKQFIGKWGKENKDSMSELNKLQSPEEFNKYWTVSVIPQYANRFAAVGGGVLTLAGHRIAGGTIGIVSPFVEFATSQIKKELYDNKKNKWDEFIKDAGNLLDNYHELLGILKQIKGNELGIVNKKLNNLRNKAGAFLEEYDGDRNKTISVLELEEQRKKLGIDLGKENLKGKENSQLGGIVSAIEELEEKITGYLQDPLKAEEANDTQDPDENKEKIDELKEEVKKIKEVIVEKNNGKNEETEKLKQKHELEDYQQIEEEIKKQKKQLLTNEDSKLKKIEELEKRIGGAKDNIEKQLMRDEFVRQEEQISQTAKKLVNGTYIIQGGKVIYKVTKNSVAKIAESPSVIGWYWEQWKERGKPVNIVETINNFQKGNGQDENFEANQSLNNSQANLLESFKKENSANEESTENVLPTQTQSEPQVIVHQDWVNIHANFTSELIQQWTNLDFTYARVKEWADAFGSNFNPSEYEFINWLAHTKNLVPEQILNNESNNYNMENLKQEFIQTQQIAQILQTNQPYGTPSSSKN